MLGFMGRLRGLDLAKGNEDRIMREIDKTYPQYLLQNTGIWNKSAYDAIRECRILDIQLEYMFLKRYCRIMESRWLVVSRARDFTCYLVKTEKILCGNWRAKKAEIDII